MVPVDAAAWGIDESYVDMYGQRRSAPRATVAALLEAMDATTDRPEPAGVRVVRHGHPEAIPGPSVLHLEDGGSMEIDAFLPPDVPLGYHRVENLESGASNSIVVVPPACFLPVDLFGWGWALQLYALRSESSWGIGDVGDLNRFAHWAADHDARFCLINPLHSTAPQVDQASPYFPGSRVWRNPIYICIDEVPGARRIGDELEDLRAQGRRLNENRVVDRTEIWRVKEAALAKLWRAFSGDPDFDRFCRKAGAALDAFAAFVVLGEMNGHDWHIWPVAYRRAERRVVERVLKEHLDRTQFVKWQQWLLDRQLREVTQKTMVIGDLAVGVSPSGFDAWYWQNVFAPGVTVGAPPDDFNLEGQGWGVLAFDPHRLRAAAYEPFALMVRRALESGGGVRLDHIMGLWRLFWIPDGASPAAGTFVRYPVQDLLGIVALESQRARSVIIGEDLGTVEPQVRVEMAERAVLSYRLLYFEESPPDRFPVDAFAAVTNHDLPTLAGLWTGVDLQAQAGAGLEPNVDFATRVKTRISRLTGLAPDASVSEVIPAVYASLAQAPSRLVAATLEDGLAVNERPNHPGTGPEQPNWSLALPYSLDAIESHPGVRQLAALLAKWGRTRTLG
jgi:4-alpha-glucanotransferase